MYDLKCDCVTIPSPKNKKQKKMLVVTYNKLIKLKLNKRFEVMLKLSYI